MSPPLAFDVNMTKTKNVQKYTKIKITLNAGVISTYLTFQDEATSFHNINEVQFKAYLREVRVCLYLS